MQDKSAGSNGAGGLLRKFLLEYLNAAGPVAAWPGSDGLTLEDILDSYPEAVARGEVPDWQDLLRRHPELVTELQTWLAAKDRGRLALRQDSRATIDAGTESTGGDE